MGKYSKWLFNYVALTIIIIFLYCICSYFYFSTPQFSLWQKNCFNIKESYARSISGKKIVFIAGSGILFGIRSKDIEEYFGIPCVNMGVHGGLQIDYILDRSKKLLNNGDLVILPLEYSSYTYDGGYRIEKSFFIRTYDREYFEELGYKEITRHLINTTPLDFLKSLKEKHSFDGNESSTGRNFYNSNTLNKNGDETAVLVTRLDRLSMAQPFDVPSNFVETYGMRKIVDFTNWCREKNVKVFLAWPNVTSFEIYNRDQFVNYFNSLKNYYQKNNIRYIGDPQSEFYDSDYFYDGIYHLTQDGITLRTENIIKLMKSDHEISSWIRNQ